MGKQEKKELEHFAKDSINALVSRIPCFGIVWDVTQAFLAASIKVRQERAVEWIELVRKHPSVFSERLFRDEQFQDGFVLLLEKYLRERDSAKRQILQKILLGFAKAEDLSSFDLERLSNVAEQITSEDIKILSIFFDGTLRKWEKSQGINPQRLGEFHNCLQFGKSMLSEMKGWSEYENENFTYERFMHLVNLGLLAQPVAHTGGIGSGYSNDRFRLSDFGNLFIEYLKTSPRS